MKKALILLVCLVTIAVTTSCNQYEAHLQPDGRSYKYLGHIGPDSCALYECFYKAPGSNYENSVLVTICPNNQSTTSQWETGSGKNRSTHNNVCVYDTTEICHVIINDTIQK